MQKLNFDLKYDIRTEVNKFRSCMAVSGIKGLRKIPVVFEGLCHVTPPGRPLPAENCGT